MKLLFCTGFFYNQQSPTIGIILLIADDKKKEPKSKPLDIVVQSMKRRHFIDDKQLQGHPNYRNPLPIIFHCKVWSAIKWRRIAYNHKLAYNRAVNKTMLFGTTIGK